MRGTESSSGPAEHLNDFSLPPAIPVRAERMGSDGVNLEPTRGLEFYTRVLFHLWKGHLGVLSHAAHLVQFGGFAEGLLLLTGAVDAGHLHGVGDGHLGRGRSREHRQLPRTQSHCPPHTGHTWAGAPHFRRAPLRTGTRGSCRRSTGVCAHTHAHTLKTKAALCCGCTRVSSRNDSGEWLGAHRCADSQSLLLPVDTAYQAA